MGFSLVTEGLLAAHLPNSAWVPLSSKLGYSIGFLIVILGRQQLFTENTLTVILPLFPAQECNDTSQRLGLWSIVLVANVVGTYVFAVCVAKIAIFDPRLQQAFLRISQERLGSSFGVVLVRARFAGWLIALMVWLLPGAESARVSIIIIITYLIGVGGFNHVIAGSNKCSSSSQAAPKAGVPISRTSFCRRWPATLSAAFLLLLFWATLKSSLARNPNLSRLSVPRFTAIHSLARDGVSSIEWVGLGGRNLTFCAHCR